MPVRLLEWRAGRVRDPVARLQWLRRRTSAAGAVSESKPRRAARYDRAVAGAIAMAFMLAGGAVLRPRVTAPSAAAARRPEPEIRQDSKLQSAASPPRVWLVETTAQWDLYSNGLRVENQFATNTAPRGYTALSRRLDNSVEVRGEPAGVVFHTTESHLSPFEEEQNRALRRDGEGLLEYVNRRRAYHFVIDRFGRVFRIVRESDYANHAGNSVWADERWIYVNLNQSFFGIAFEARSDVNTQDPAIDAAQLHAGRILVEMLRARYAIPAGNCVAHAQVSVNPGNGRAGYHTDWAANLPFAELGLGNNYALPLPSLALFGFEPDAALLQSSGALQQGIEAGADAAREEAKARNLTLEQYRRVLQRKYRDALAAQQARTVEQ
ncbi:MAG TPA: peptidoglycan recognition family protein [Bryobacteraceae bacterium]|nr:peptidoglycan recognition family protein [Bryobacteraceae bacterium]